MDVLTQAPTEACVAVHRGSTPLEVAQPLITRA